MPGSLGDNEHDGPKSGVTQWIQGDLVRSKRRLQCGKPAASLTTRSGERELTDDVADDADDDGPIGRRDGQLIFC